MGLHRARSELTIAHIESKIEDAAAPIYSSGKVLSSVMTESASNHNRVQSVISEFRLTGAFLSSTNHIVRPESLEDHR